MRRRDEAEFVEFASTAVRRLRRTAYLMCGDWHRAEDAAQDALVRVYAAWPRLDRGGGLTSYAHKAVVSVVLDQAKRPWRRERPAEDQFQHPAGRDEAGAVDTRLLVVGALARLPPRQRACVVLRHYADMSVEDTAQTLGISPGTVKSQASRGLARLRELLDLTSDTPEPQSVERTTR